MNDPEGVNDTEPSGRPGASTEPNTDTDPGGGDVTETVPTSPAGREANATEDNADDFFRWLPTMWLWHRRRKELVQRRSSDGADFVVYASAGRPVRASPRAAAEASVQVQLPLSSGSAERDAPTVSLPKRNGVAGRKGVAFGSAVLVLVSATVAIGAWTHRPLGEDAAARAVATSLAPTLGSLAAPTESTALPAPPAHASAQDPVGHALETRTGPRAMAGAPSIKESNRKWDGIRAAALGGDAPVTNRAPPSATPPKDQYFEEP